MKLPGNILVYRFGTVAPKAAFARGRTASGVSKGVNVKMRSNVARKISTRPLSKASKKMATRGAGSGIKPGPLPVTVGVWNLDDYWLGYLPAWLEILNKKQDRYRFYMIEAPVPLGMVRKPEGVVAWAQELLSAPLEAADVKEMKSHTIAEEYFAIAKAVRKEVRVSTSKGAAELDYLVGITPGMVAGVENTQVYWNHFSTASGRLVLTSLFDMRRYAKETTKPLAAFVIGVIVAQLLVAQFHQHGLGFHTEDRGCMFDYNGDRESLKTSILKMEIEPECFNLIPADFQPAVGNILKAIKKLK